MTKVFADQKGSKFDLVLCGHASGSETVCAAISSIVYALAGYLANCDKKSDSNSVSELESGFSVFHFSGKEKKPAYDMAVIGLMQLAEKYPQYIQFEKK